MRIPKLFYTSTLHVMFVKMPVVFFAAYMYFYLFYKMYFTKNLSTIDD